MSAGILIRNPLGLLVVVIIKLNCGVSLCSLTPLPLVWDVSVLADGIPVPCRLPVPGVLDEVDRSPGGVVTSGGDTVVPDGGT